MIDAYIAGRGIAAPPPEPDPNVPAMPDLDGSDLLTSIDLADAEVSTIIWCVGFDGDLTWIDDDLLDDDGVLPHRDGVGASPGLYVIGWPWLSTRRSGILLGVPADADRIVGHLTARRGRAA